MTTILKTPSSYALEYHEKDDVLDIRFWKARRFKANISPEEVSGVAIGRDKTTGNLQFLRIFYFKTAPPERKKSLTKLLKLYNVKVPPISSIK